jgi:hypothetical protein
VALIKYGFSPDEAHSMSPYLRLAYLVVFGELEGATFDWNAMAWVKEN